MAPFIEHHGLGPRAYRMHKLGLLRLPVGLEKPFKQSLLTQIFRSKQYEESLKLLSELFRKSTFPWLVLKGQALAERFYENPLERLYSDLDILALPESRPFLSQLLEDMGFQAIQEKKVRENQHKQLFIPDSPQYLPIEVHFGFGHYPLNSGDCLSQTETWRLQNQDGPLYQIPVASTERERDYLIFHACVQHRMSHLKWMLDFLEMALPIEAFTPKEDEHPSLQKSKNFLQETLCYLKSNSKKNRPKLWQWILNDNPWLYRYKVFHVRSHFTSPLSVLDFQLRKRNA